MESALFLLQDKKLKLDAVRKLSKAKSTIERQELDDSTNLDLMKHVSNASSSIKQLFSLVIPV